jgi:hypothetical protein
MADAHEVPDADLAVLDMALTEVLDPRTPRDVWPALAARSERRLVATTPWRSWLAAAVLLFAFGVAAVWAFSKHEPHTFASEPWRDPEGPASLAELAARVQNAKSASLQARGTWSDELGRWVAWTRTPLDDLFRGRLRPDVERDDLQAIAANLAKTRENTGAVERVWTHTINFGARCTMLVQYRDGTVPRVGFASPRGAVDLDGAPLPGDLLRALTELTRTTIAELGIVVGAGGFAAVPSTAQALQLVAVPATALAEFTRFINVQKVDLSLAPEWHSAAALGTIANAPLRSLWLRADLLTPPAFPTIARLQALDSLWLMPPDMFVTMLDTNAMFDTGRPPRAASLDDAAMAALATVPKLRELGLAGGVFTDDGLRALGTLPLTELILLACDRVRGDTLPSFRSVRRLTLTHCRGLRPDLLATVGAPGAMPALRAINLIGVVRGSRLDAMPANTDVSGLTVTGAFDVQQAGALATCMALEKLALQREPPLRDVDLEPLRALQHLRYLKLGSDALTAEGVDALRAALPKCRISREIW